MPEARRPSAERADPPGPPAEVAFRIATPGDAGQLTACLKTYRGEINVPPAPAHQVALYVGGLLMSPTIRTIVAVREDRIVGFAIVGCSFSTSRLCRALYCSDLWVAAEHREQGIGTALIRQMKDYAARDGMDFLYGVADSGNEPLQRFHRDNGWTSTGLVFMYIEQPRNPPADDAPNEDRPARPG